MQDQIPSQPAQRKAWVPPKRRRMISDSAEQSANEGADGSNLS